MIPRSLLTVFILAALGIIIRAKTVQAAYPDTLNITIQGLKSTTGQVCLSLYNQPENFPIQPEKSFQNQCVKIPKTPLQVAFKNLAPGNYALAVLHDANDNGKLDTSVLGLPMEGFGFSGNPALMITVPTFDQSVVKVSGPSTNISVVLRYLPGAKY